MKDLAVNFLKVRERINAAAVKSGVVSVDLVAVTKTVAADRILAAAALGQIDFGENRVQEALPKLKLCPQATWHFIGRLQTNKVKDVVGRFHLIQSLDRWKLALALNEEAARLKMRQQVLVQINIGGEEQKGGILPERLAAFLEEASKLTYLQIAGFMTVPPYSEDPEKVRPYFYQMRQLFERYKEKYQMKTLSMGMSNDFAVAVEEGSTMVRVGSALFGERA